MTDDIRSELAAIKSKLDHIDKVVTGPPPLERRLTLLESVRPTNLELAEIVDHNKIAYAVADALEAQRVQAAAAMRSTIHLVAAVAGTASAIVVSILQFVFRQGVM